MSTNPRHPTANRFKRIHEYSAAELKAAINRAQDACRAANLDFYIVLNGIDAYMEERLRKFEEMDLTDEQKRKDFIDANPNEQPT